MQRFLKKHPEVSMGETTCIKNFPDRFDGDSTKSGVRTEVILEEGRFFFEEYSFSKKYLESRAMEVTFPFALYEDSDREFVSMVEDILCLMFRAASEAQFEVMEPYMTEIELEYLGIKK